MPDAPPDPPVPITASAVSKPAQASAAGSASPTGQSVAGTTQTDRRDSFLLQMYTQTWNNINRHLTVIWQSVGVLAGAFAILSLVEKHIVTTDLATAIVVLISGWLVAHSYDASNWFNRNQTIITNIERQFLQKSDLEEIHPYFAKHREVGSMVTHLIIQQALGYGIGVAMLIYHFQTQVVPGFGAPWNTFSFAKCLPYFALLFCIFGVLWVRKRARRDESEFLSRSPGKKII